MKKLLLATVAAATLIALPALADREITKRTWDEVQSFLERNPRVLTQIEIMMDKEIGPDQIEQDASFIAENHERIFEDPMSPVLGNPEGEVVIVKFTDFRCGYCEAVTPELEALIEKDPRVKLIIREFPILGPDSIELAKFALSVRKIGGDAAYKRAQEAIFASDGPVTGYRLEELAEAAQVDPRATIEGMESAEILEHLTETVRLARELKITGTPGLILRDQVIRGFIPLEALEQGVAELYPAR